MADLDPIGERLRPETLEELRAVPITRGRPLVAVDVDDTLVVFVDHLSRWMRGRGFEMRLESYQLEGSMFPLGSDRPLDFEECIGLIRDFFSAETEAQQAMPGAPEAMAELAEIAQVVILTNVPRHAAAARRANLDALGFRHPLVINAGGKGRAMAWLAEKAGAPVALIDDSSAQMQSVEKHVPDAVRLHFAGAEHIRRLYPECAHATEQVHDWPGCVAAVRRLMNGA